MNNLQIYIKRQQELKKIMETSDRYASKCIKMGLVFKDVYPEKYAEYIAANDEYNANEIAMQPLLEERQLRITSRKEEAKQIAAQLRTQRKLIK